MNSYNKNKYALVCVRVYQKFLSPIIGNRCIYSPSCSEYMYLAIKKYNLVKGIYLGMKRFLRCHPFSKGGYDPIK